MKSSSNTLHTFRSIYYSSKSEIKKRKPGYLKCCAWLNERTLIGRNPVGISKKKEKERINQKSKVSCINVHLMKVRPSPILSPQNISSKHKSNQNKEFSLCHKLWFSDIYILETQCPKPWIFLLYFRAEINTVFGDIDSFKKEKQDNAIQIEQLKRYVNRLEQEKIEENRAQVYHLSTLLNNLETSVGATAQVNKKDREKNIFMKSISVFSSENPKGFQTIRRRWKTNYFR